VTSLDALRVKIFADGADLRGMRAMAEKPFVRGFTTNATLMRRAGVTDMRTFARDVLAAVHDRPVCFGVTTDLVSDMEREAHEIGAWADNVYVKIPVTTGSGAPTAELVRRLSRAGLKLNVTAVLTIDQVRAAADALYGGAPSHISILAGRIADTGRDPVPMMRAALELLREAPEVELVWASPRELLNVVQADAIGCPIITATNDILAKLPLLGKDLDELSLETVRALHGDASAAGYRP
jgi:transaldolase